jgi:hypothetical protein
VALFGVFVLLAGVGLSVVLVEVKERCESALSLKERISCWYNRFRARRLQRRA